MRKSSISLLLACTLLSLSAHGNDNNSVIELKGTVQSINEELSSQRASIGKINSNLDYLERENSSFQRNVLNELKALRRQNQSLVDSLFSNGGSNNAKGNVMDVKPVRNYDLQTPDGKMYFGEDEFIYIKEANAMFDCRIDTGAAVSSISATNITEFERKGKKWYRFTMEVNDRTLELEAPFVRYSTIRQSSKSTSTERPVVSLNVKIGDYSNTSEFTLADRRKLNYPVLIGRTLIQDIAVVDVSRNHVQQDKNSDILLILSRDNYNELKKKGINPNEEFERKNKNQAGQIAYPSKDYGSNLGTDADLSLPEVREKISSKQNAKQ
ncbi:ATP-dependent zinc protease family protein [Anaerobiospirillum thomasii]|uniref:Uncharacterized protein conserved in archaea n=1 Tax=Anaerobiospirillum thomasii TaxID=179995 RepID=A0A2X0VL26_9GAMM|nr:ATP-dependent zinc protease [Anaerobiospirillum thomasii]SPT70168.1 Uncharacterized protein conserved in archaea [Anaerobiospirillum thomasii]